MVTELSSFTDMSISSSFTRPKSSRVLWDISSTFPISITLVGVSSTTVLPSVVRLPFSPSYMYTPEGTSSAAPIVSVSASSTASISSTSSVGVTSSCVGFLPCSNSSNSVRISDSDSGVPCATSSPVLASGCTGTSLVVCS